MRSSHAPEAAPKPELCACLDELLAVGDLPARGWFRGRPATIEAAAYNEHSIGFWVSDGHQPFRSPITDVSFDDDALESARVNAERALLDGYFGRPITNLDALRSDSDHLCELLWRQRTALAEHLHEGGSEDDIAAAAHAALCGIELLDGMGHTADAVEQANDVVSLLLSAFADEPSATLGAAVCAAAGCLVSVESATEWVHASGQIDVLLDAFRDADAVAYVLGTGSLFLAAVMAMPDEALRVWRQGFAKRTDYQAAAFALDLLDARTLREADNTLDSYPLDVVASGAAALRFHATPQHLKRLSATVQRVAESPKRSALLRGLSENAPSTDQRSVLRTAALADPNSRALLEWASHAGSDFLDDDELRPTLPTLFVLCMRYPAFAHVLAQRVESMTLDELASVSSWTLQDIAPFLASHEHYVAAIIAFGALALRHANRGKSHYYGLGVDAIREALTLGEHHDQFDLADAIACEIVDRHHAKFAFSGPAQLALQRAYRRMGM